MRKYLVKLLARQSFIECPDIDILHRMLSYHKAGVGRAIFDVDNHARADCEAFYVRDLLEIVIERDEALDLANKHPKSVVPIGNGSMF